MSYPFLAAKGSEGDETLFSGAGRSRLAMPDTSKRFPPKYIFVPQTSLYFDAEKQRQIGIMGSKQRHLSSLTAKDDISKVSEDTGPKLLFFCSICSSVQPH